MKRKDLEQVIDDVVSSPSSKSRRLDAELLGVNINGDPSGSAFQVFQPRPHLERSLKRKELDEAFNDMSSPSLKSRRLDAEMLSGFEQMASQQEMVDEGLLGLPLENDEKALVLYNPANSQPFYKTPSSKDFSIIVNSNLIPGLRDQIFAQGNSKWPTQSVVEENNIEEEDSKGCMDIVPWVESTWPPASSYSETQAASLSEPEEVEMMDTDETGNNGFSSGVIMNGSDRLQQWHNQQQQLHCMQPQLPGNNTYTNPITW